MNLSGRIVSIITNQLGRTNPPRTSENSNPISFAEAIKLASKPQSTNSPQNEFSRNKNLVTF